MFLGLRTNPDLDFPDLLGQKCGVRQDTRMSSQSGRTGTADPAPVSADTTRDGILLRSVRHAYGELQTLAGIDLEAAPHSVIGLVGPSGCGKSTLLEVICG